MTTETSGDPKVSICGQIYNQSAWAREMIETVIAQTYANWELIMVDDGSTDGLKEVFDSFNDPRLKYLRFDENKGVPKGTNVALKAATGKYVCLAAADERFYHTKLYDQVEYLEAHPKVDCCWGLPGNGNDKYPMGPRPEWEQYALNSHNRSRYAWLRTLVQLEGVPIGGCGLMMKKSVMDELGGLNETLKTFSDHELYCRFFEKYIGVIIPIRVAVDRPFAENQNSVRMANNERTLIEHEIVKGLHAVVLPPTTGKVTVGIAIYNMAKYLPDAVNSVIAQTYQDLEILICDDGSTDDFKTVVQQFTDPRIRVMAFEKNMGREEAQNFLVATATGEFYVSMAADDTIEPTFVERCLAEFKADPWVEFVATQTDFRGEDITVAYDFVAHPEFADLARIKKAANHATRHDWLADLFNGNHYFGIGMYRTYAVLEVGGWEKEYKVISDYQMYLKLLQRENIRIIEEDLTHTRVTGNNASLLNKERVEELPHLYHAAKKRFFRPRMKVIIATPFYELKGFSPYIASLTQTIRLLTACGIDWRFMELSGDSYVHRARNTMCNTFLADPDATDLFFIDSDMAWNPEALVNMLMLPDGVVGGSYPVKNNWENWTSVPRMHEEHGTMHYRGRPLQDGSALIEAQVLAGGFLRIKRLVLEQFREHYPDLWYTEPTTDPEHPEHRFTQFFAAESFEHRFYGEDHMFSKRMRDMGQQMFIYPNATINHYGIRGWEGNLDSWLKKKADEERPRASV